MEDIFVGDTVIDTVSEMTGKVKSINGNQVLIESSWDILADINNIEKV